MLRALLPAALLCACLSAVAQAPAPAPAEEQPLAQDLHEEVVRIGVVVRDMFGRQEQRQIPVTIYRPAGDGPFPVAVFNHGRATTERRAQQGRSRPEPLARYLVRKGFVVLAPTRVGYGETYGEFDPETSGPCLAPRPEAMSLAASEQVLATVEFARTLPYADTARWIVLGTSVGGLATLATAWRNPPGLVAGINFAGGTGGDPERTPGQPCTPAALTHLWGTKGREARVPVLWLYWENDQYWGADNPRRWHKAWAEGAAPAAFHQLPAAGKDGHLGLTIDMDRWVPLVESFLAGLGFDRPGTVPRPPATAFAVVAEIDKVPASERARQAFYRRFLEAPLPRAFAIGARGVGWATGDWALGRALGNCERRGDACRLYAVDNDVVWSLP